MVITENMQNQEAAAFRVKRNIAIGLVLAVSLASGFLLWQGSPYRHDRLLTTILLVAMPIILATLGILYVRLMKELVDRDHSQVTQQRLNRDLRLLSACNMALVRAKDEAKLLDEICQLIVEIGGYKMAWVGYPDDGLDKTVRPISQWGFENGYLGNIHISWGDNEAGRGPTGCAIRTGKTHINQNVLTNPAMTPWREQALNMGYHSSIAIPLTFGDQVLGALTLYSGSLDAFFPEEVRLLEEMATDLAFGIATIRDRAICDVAQERVTFLDAHDPLTTLPNRLLARDRFSQAIAAAARHNSRVGILFLDVDNFSALNNSLGPDVCDILLVQAVNRLQRCLPEGTTISRQSGDEFTVQITDIDDITHLGTMAEQILSAFAVPFDLNGTLSNLSFSIGVSLYPDDGSDFDTLVKCAHSATREAKASGRNTYRFFTTSMNDNVTHDMLLRHRMPLALKNNEFVLHYQPQIDMRSGEIIGVEALVRWQHPDEGLIPPLHFISLAEESGFIIPLGEWVLNEACRQAKAWMDAGYPPMVIAVNLSSLQFRRGNTAHVVAQALETYDLPAAYLELELTESILLNDSQGAIKTIQMLRDMGIKLSIDDFGTGYSSLGYLKRLPLDKLKIDQSFVRSLPNDPDDSAIVTAIIEMGHALRLEVIAEGVETEEQFNELRAYGCDQIQGYWISRPMPPSQLSTFRVAHALAKTPLAAALKDKTGR